MKTLLDFLNARRKTIAAFVSYAISVVVWQETMSHPFTGNWWVSLVTGAGVLMGVYVSPNTQPATMTDQVQPVQPSVQITQTPPPAGTATAVGWGAKP